MSLMLAYPLEISPRLLPSIRIGKAWLSLNIETMDSFFLDIEGTEYIVDGFTFHACKDKSELVREAFSTFISFAMASNEAIEFGRRSRYKSDNEELFREPIRTFLYDNSYDIDGLWVDFHQENS